MKEKINELMIKCCKQLHYYVGYRQKVVETQKGNERIKNLYYTEGRILSLQEFIDFLDYLIKEVKE